jgi:hypothetical protein
MIGKYHHSYSKAKKFIRLACLIHHVLCLAEYGRYRLKNTNSCQVWIALKLASLKQAECHSNSLTKISVTPRPWSPLPSFKLINLYLKVTELDI